jgi:hypothetical protein
MKCGLAEVESEAMGECKELREKVSRIYLQVEKLQEQLHNGKQGNIATSPRNDATSPSGRDSVVPAGTNDDDNPSVDISSNLRSEGVSDTVRRCMSGFSDNCESGHESRHLCSGTPFQYPAAVELPLPTFENEGDQNAGLHLKMLREYFELKILPRLWLPLALRSLRGNSVRAWSVAITDTVTSYSEFEKAFLGKFWDDIMQNRARCRLYQEKYDT